MTDYFQSPTAGRPELEVFETVRTANLDWRDGGGKGFWVKTLYHDPETGRETLLLKVDAGAYSASHSHDRLEQVYVIEGDFYDQNTTYHGGDFVMRKRGQNHVAGSKNGALIVLIFG